MTYRRTAVAVAAALSLPAAVHALQLDAGSPDTQIRLDFTAKYSTAFRLKNAQSPLTGTPADPGTFNENDGDNNFKKGLISNRVDLLSEFDLTSTWGGLRLSGAGFYDDVYRRANDNDAANVVNRYPGQPANEFTGFTRRQHGADAQLLDAFAFVKTELGGGASAVVRLGKHTLLYGESLFFGQNGIAAAQGPVDVAKAVSVPGWQFKEVLLPVEQVSAQVQLRPGLSVGGYYQFKWRPSRVPGAGSYFSNQEYINTESTYVDLSDLSALGVSPDIARMHLALYDSAYDVKPKNNGQGGVQLRWMPAGSEFEYGFYAARYHDKAPAVPVFDLVNDRVNTVWAQGITTLGSSVTSSVGQLNWALEGSIRWNAPLNSSPAMTAGAACGNSGGNRCFATGKTAHLNLSGIYVLQPNALWGEARG